MKTIAWKLEKRKVLDVAPADYNPRVLTDKQRADLTASLEKFGQAEPLVINTSGTLIGGHQRIKVLSDLGVEDVDVMVPDRKLSAAEEHELNLRLNRNVGEWDWLKLKQFFNLEELRSVGFEQDELSKYFDKTAEVEEDNFDADAEAAKIKQPVTGMGYIWQLGDHRLICGNSTERETFDALLGDERADMCWTDPPYNVAYNHRKKYGGIHRGRKGAFAGGDEVKGDDQTSEQFQAFLHLAFGNISDALKPGGRAYICFATKSQKEFFEAFDTAGMHFSQMIIWLKERIIMAMGQDYHRIYEPIMYGWKRGNKRWSNRGIRTESEVWDLDRMSFEERLDVWYLHRDKSKDYVHPTQKPVRLPERAIKKSCPIGGIVIEPFCGSGSALMACEQLQRRCFGIELDPRYADVIVRRWQRYTKRTAVCLTHREAVILEV